MFKSPILAIFSGVNEDDRLQTASNDQLPTTSQLPIGAGHLTHGPRTSLALLTSPPPCRHGLHKPEKGARGAQRSKDSVHGIMRQDPAHP
jgi:hypothetical protein